MKIFTKTNEICCIIIRQVRVSIKCRVRHDIVWLALSWLVEKKTTSTFVPGHIIQTENDCGGVGVS